VRRAAALFAVCALLGCAQPKPDVVVHPASQPPPLLSEWGVVYARGQRLELNAGVIPYELNAPLFSDYALKLRTIWLPPGSRAEYAANREFDFPVGTIISKTFYYEKASDWAPDRHAVVMTDRQHELLPAGTLPTDQYLLLETRLLVRYADGWHAYPYVWNAAQDDATLEIAGDVHALELVGATDRQNINYVVPDANQCSGCHTPDHSAAEMRPLGPKAWQLNRPYAWWGDAVNQLQHWSEAGLLQGAPAVLPAVPVTAEWRVRAYLDANCAHCHNPVGAADTSALHLNIEAPVDRHLGVCKTPVAVGRGSGDRPYDIYPGRPDDSILLYRMQHADPAIAMPELGRSAIHAEGVAMVRAWIAAMPGEC
jgi:uncharacterized repeat protein (TIGR03806 family)